MKTKTCINCGAPLYGRVCEYCGTDYSEIGSFQACFESDDAFGTLKIGSREYTCYIGSMSTADIVFKGLPIAKKRKFTLIER